MACQIMANPVTFLEIFLYIYTTILLNFPEKSKVANEYDYIVVGAGSAGSVVANRLSENRNVRVLLLEAGGVPSQISTIPLLADQQWNSTYSWNYYTTPQEESCLGFPNKACFWPRGKLLGGTSEINGMLHVVGNKADYDEWEEFGIDGWNYEDVHPYFMKMENFTIDDGIAESEYHGTKGPVTISDIKYKTPFFEPFMKAVEEKGFPILDYNGESQLGFGPVQTATVNGERCGTYKAYLEPAVNRPNLDIITHAVVNKIKFTADKTARAVEFTLNGKTQSARARKEIILSAGAIGSPQLLLLSGIGPKKDLEKLKIKVIQDLPVGKNLQDHITSFGISYVTNVSQTVQWKYAVTPDNVNDYLRERTGPLTVPCGIEIIGFIQTNASEKGSKFADNQIYLIPQDYNAHLPEAFVRPYNDKYVISLLSQPLKPLSTGTVSLRSSNPKDPPLVNPRHLTDKADYPPMISGMRLIMELAKSKHMAHLGLQLYNTTVPGCENMVKWSDDYLICMAKHLTFTTSHNVGTCRMGALDDPRTVVDSELRVKGVKHLRVADASIIPRIVSANTNSPSIMIGERVADFIRGIRTV